MTKANPKLVSLFAILFMFSPFCIHFREGKAQRRDAKQKRPDECTQSELTENARELTLRVKCSRFEVDGADHIAAAENCQRFWIRITGHELVWAR
jgi:hypothetical protein